MDTVDAELGRLISKRASQDQRPDPDEQEEIWKKSVRAYTVQKREENRREWHGYFCHLAACLRSRAAEYDQRAEALMEATDERKTA